MERELTFLGHLEEMRRRIIVVLVVFVVMLALSLPFAAVILKVLKAPAEGYVGKLAYFSPEEAFVVYMRIGCLAALLLTLPVALYQLWEFLAPAIDARYRRHVVRFVTASTAAFVCGCLFSYFLLMPQALKFLLGIGSEDLVAVISASRYVSFVVGMMIACGAVFEMPVLSFILTRVGILKPDMLRSRRKEAVVVIAVASAAITPTTDIFNMVLLMVPMVLLYQVSIWVSWLALSRRTVELSRNLV